jgi:hypothetical protein
MCTGTLENIEMAASWHRVESVGLNSGLIVNLINLKFMNVSTKSATVIN